MSLVVTKELARMRALQVFVLLGIAAALIGCAAVERRCGKPYQYSNGKHYQHCDLIVHETVECVGSCLEGKLVK